MILLTVPVLATARAVTEFIRHTGEKMKGAAKDEEYAMSDVPTKGPEEKGSTEGISPTVESIEVS